MYDVQQPVTAMDWVDGKSLCIATSSGLKYELLELLLPDKMIETEEQGVLKKDRDFRVNAGGFCPRKVTELKHIPGTRLCVLSDTENRGISVWQIGTSETDLMQEVQSLQIKRQNGFPVRISVVEVPDGHTVAFGSSLNNITVADRNTLLTLRNTENGALKSEPLSTVHHRDRDTLMTCSRCSGAINVLDFRSEQVKVKEVQCQEKASFWTMSNIDSQSSDFLLLSSDGEMLIKDLRYLDENVEKFQTSLCTSENFECLSIQKGKTNDLFSVSGFDGNVYIFKKESSRCDKTVEPLFQHEGHLMNQEDQSNPLLVTKHLWHPWQQDMVISAATDGSLHAWQYQLNTIK